MDSKIIVALVVCAICLVGSLIIAPMLYDNVLAGTYHITQNPMTGNIEARLTPGPYAQMFSNITIFPVSETFFFTSDDEGGKGDTSIEVQFSDGSKCKITGTCRVDLPTNPEQAIALVSKHGYTSQTNLEDRLILQILRNGLMAAANQMTAKESYSDKRLNFVSDARDQILHGVWKTKDVIIKEIDPSTKQEVTVIKKVPITNSEGVVIREPNPLDNTGITLSQFTIKEFNYEEKVKKQIESQQMAIMAVQTAKANLLKAEQDRLTVEAEGKAKVMTAQYEEEQKKIRATVEAKKEREVATISAQKQVDVANKEKEQAIILATKEKEVAVLQRDAALLVKEQKIALGQGEAEAKRLIFEADGALGVKANALIEINKHWADAFKTRPVPSIVMSGKDGVSTDSDASTLMQLMTMSAAKQLGVDMTVQKIK